MSLSEKVIQRRREGAINTMEQLWDMEAWVAEKIWADSVKYNSLETFVTALGIPRENLCLKFWDGISPARE